MNNELNFDLLEDDFIYDDGIQTNELAGDGLEGQEVVASGEEFHEGESSEDDSQSLPNLYSSLAKALGEEGFLPGLDSYEEIKDFNDLGEKIREINRKSIKDALGFDLDSAYELTDLQKEYLSALKDGIPAEMFIQAKKDEVAIEGISDEQIESDENLRKEIIIESYVAKGIARDKAAKLAQRSIDLAEDVEEAKASRDELLASIKANNEREIAYQRQLRLDAEKAQKEFDENMKKYFFDTDKIGESWEVNRATKDKMYEAIVKPVARTEDGQLVNAITKYQIENPIDFQHKLAWVWAVTDGFSKFDSFISAKAKSRATQELASVLNTTKFDSLGAVSDPGFDEDSRYGVRDYNFDFGN